MSQSRDMSQGRLAIHSSEAVDRSYKSFGFSFACWALLIGVDVSNAIYLNRYVVLRRNSEQLLFCSDSWIRPTDRHNRLRP